MNTCERCGKPFSVRRTGGQRKRFCSAACRAAQHRDGRSARPMASDSEVVGTLWELYHRLKADVEQYGTLLETKTGLRANPSVAELRRVAVELARLAPAKEEPPEMDLLAAVG